MSAVKVHSLPATAEQAEALEPGRSYELRVEGQRLIRAGDRLQLGPNVRASVRRVFASGPDTWLWVSIDR